MQLHYDPSGLEWLRGAANRGSGQAAAALDQMLGDRRLDIDVPAVRLAPLDLLVDRLGGDRVALAAVELPVLGTVPGRLLVALPDPGAFALAEILLRGRPAPHFDPEARSALAETGGLLAAGILGSLARSSGHTLLPGGAHFVHDTPAALLAGREPNGLHLLTRFSDRRRSGRGAMPLHSFFGHLVLVPGEALLRRMAPARW